MNAHQNRTLLAIAGFSFAALVIAAAIPSAYRALADTEWNVDVQETISAIPKQFGEQTDVLVSDDVLLADMSAHATRHFGRFSPIAGTSGAVDGWSDRWILCWLDVKHAGGVARVYRVIERQPPHRRYTISWEDRNAKWTEWERAQ